MKKKKIKQAEIKDLNKKVGSKLKVKARSRLLFRSSSPKPRQKSHFKVKYKTEGFGDFEYYAFLDYSQELIGYSVIRKDNLKELLAKIARLHSYKEIKHKQKYLAKIKKLDWKKIKKLMDYNIVKITSSEKILLSIIEFIKENNESLGFISVSDHYYNSFSKMIEMSERRHNYLIVKESDIKKDSNEYKLSLVIETLLNLERNGGKRNAKPSK
ncbi:MAG: hypothetical protein Q8N99_01770 [Nanoarchaeota archaeon]|nr:hypothetical protein [Nanoarchaeota archaeon]